MSRVQPHHGKTRERALLLVGHGSLRSPETGRPVRALAEEIRDRAEYGEVRVAFLKESPYLRDALRRIESPSVAVVPIFTSRGHYTARVIPDELALDAPHRRPPDLEVHLCPPLGTHPGMSEVILDRARGEIERRDEPGGREAVEAEIEALVVVGHGTPRHPASGDVTRDLVDRLRPEWPHGPVAAAFLDESPRISEVLRTLDVPRAVIVPFFIAPGWHAGVTLPRSIGVDGGTGSVGGTLVRYTPPVGTDPRMADFVLDLARGDVRQNPRAAGPLPLARAARTRRRAP